MVYILEPLSCLVSVNQSRLESFQWEILTCSFITLAFFRLKVQTQLDVTPSERDINSTFGLHDYLKNSSLINELINSKFVRPTRCPVISTLISWEDTGRVHQPDITGQRELVRALLLCVIKLLAFALGQGPQQQESCKKHRF